MRPGPHSGQSLYGHSNHSGQFRSVPNGQSSQPNQAGSSGPYPPYGNNNFPFVNQGNQYIDAHGPQNGQNMTYGNTVSHMGPLAPQYHQGYQGYQGYHQGGYHQGYPNAYQQGYQNVNFTGQYYAPYAQSPQYPQSLPGPPQVNSRSTFYTNERASNSSGSLLRNEIHPDKPTAVTGNTPNAPTTAAPGPPIHSLPVSNRTLGRKGLYLRENNTTGHLPNVPNGFELPQNKRSTSIAQTAHNLSNRSARVPAMPRSASISFDDLHPLDLDVPPIPLAVSPPPPLISKSMPSSPARSSSRSRSGSRLARMFGMRDRESPRVSSSNSSRTNSPLSFASRLSNRISSGLSLRGSSLGTSGSTVSLLEMSGSHEPKELNNDWTPFEPRRPPNDTVRSDFSKFAVSKVPLFDIDSHLENSLPQAVNPQLPQMRQFANRGVYFYGQASQLGQTDPEGNYRANRGEQLGFRYNVVDELGRGSFGTVLRCRDHRTGRMVAVKVTANRSELQGQARVEAKLLRSLLVEHKGDPGKHHFLRYIEHFQFQHHLCIATELLGPNLFEVSKRNRFHGLKEDTVKYITRQIVEGLEFLTSQSIIHCDLKPENILVSDTERCQVKIVDFGSGCYERSRVYTYIQSRFYRAPEILLGMPYRAPIDMWSLGAIIPELLVGRPLFPSKNESDQVGLMCQVLGLPGPDVLMRCRRQATFFTPEGYLIEPRVPGSTPLPKILEQFSNEAIDFCTQLLQWVPEHRLTAAKAIYHPFIISS